MFVPNVKSEQDEEDNAKWSQKMQTVNREERALYT